LPDGPSPPPIQLISNHRTEDIPQFEPCGFLSIPESSHEGGCEWIHMDHVSLFGFAAFQFRRYGEEKGFKVK
jgi:hypothetical protein